MLRISGKVRILDNKSLELAQHQSRAPACAIRENDIGNLREKAGKRSALEKYRHAFNVGGYRSLPRVQTPKRNK